jgi:predicted PurR-regulated permease PerM
VLVISAIQGTLGTVIFWILGLPSPLLWGVVMFFLSMIPMAGSFLVWVPAALYLALTSEYVRAGILVGWGILVIGSIDSFLSPKLVGQRTRLHELLIFFAVLGGLEVFGVLGLVLGPVVVAVTLALIEDGAAGPSSAVGHQRRVHGPGAAVGAARGQLTRACHVL